MQYLNNAAMDKAIKSIEGRGVKLQHEIQSVGLSAINAVAECGNTFYVNRLFNAVRALKGMRSSASGPVATRLLREAEVIYVYADLGVDEETGEQVAIPVEPLPDDACAVWPVAEHVLAVWCRSDVTLH